MRRHVHIVSSVCHRIPHVRRTWATRLSTWTARSGRVAAALLLVAAFGLSTGCQTSITPPNANGTDGGGASQTDGGAVSFSADLEPILTTLCSTCHREGGIADQAGIDLRLTADVALDMLLNDRSVQDPSLAFVVAGDADASLVFLKISSDSPPVGTRMPFALAPLDDGQIALIRDWINQGALDN